MLLPIEISNFIKWSRNAIRWKYFGLGYFIVIVIIFTILLKIHLVYSIDYRQYVLKITDI